MASNDHVTPNVLPLLFKHQNTTVKPRARDYLVDGVAYPRVTTALGIISKPALVGWAVRVALDDVTAILLSPDVGAEIGLAFEESPEHYKDFVSKLIERARKGPGDKRDERAGSGTEIHQLIQSILAAPTAVRHIPWANVPMEQRASVEAAFDFLADYEIEVCDSERVVWSPEHKIAGTIDGVGFIDGQLVIWDWKTSAKIYWETALQLSAYAQLLKELTGQEVTAAYAVRLPRPGDETTYGVKAISAENLVKGWATYRSSLSLHQGSKHKWWEEKDE